jgi:hypothetical protein
LNDFLVLYGQLAAYAVFFIWACLTDQWSMTTQQGFLFLSNPGNRAKILLDLKPERAKPALPDGWQVRHEPGGKARDFGSHPPFASVGLNTGLWHNAAQITRNSDHKIVTKNSGRPSQHLRIEMRRCVPLAVDHAARLGRRQQSEDFGLKQTELDFGLYDPSFEKSSCGVGFMT